MSGPLLHAGRHVPHARFAASSREPQHFHQRLPGYAPTPLRELPQLASRLGVARVWVKDESARLGLGSFKVLGASWAIYQALQQRLGQPFAPWDTLAQLVPQLAPLRPLTLCAATEGNHGMAVARLARLLGLEAHIFVPGQMEHTRRAALEGEGARVERVAGGYDEAVRACAWSASAARLVIADTSADGEARVPGWVVEGYATLFWEVEDALAAKGEPWPDVVVVPMGVGTLAAAAVRHVRRSPEGPQATLLGVEPALADCVRASLVAGRPVPLAPPPRSRMAGLNCGMPSPAVWPELSQGLDCVVTVADEAAVEAKAELAALDVRTRETGAAALAGVRTALRLGGQQACCLGPDARVLLLVTEGFTETGAIRVPSVTRGTSGAGL